MSYTFFAAKGSKITKSFDVRARAKITSTIWYPIIIFLNGEREVSFPTPIEPKLWHIQCAFLCRSSLEHFGYRRSTSQVKASGVRGQLFCPRVICACLVWASRSPTPGSAGLLSLRNETIISEMNFVKYSI